MKPETMALRERIDLLEEEVRQLREQLMPEGIHPPCHLPPARLTLFRMLATGRRISREAAMRALYSDRIDAEPDPQVVTVHISLLRKALAPYGYRIPTAVWGRGWKMEWPADQAESGQ